MRSIKSYCAVWGVAVLGSDVVEVVWWWCGGGAKQEDRLRSATQVVQPGTKNVVPGTYGTFRRSETMDAERTRDWQFDDIGQSEPAF